MCDFFKWTDRWIVGVGVRWNGQRPRVDSRTRLNMYGLIDDFRIVRDGFLSLLTPRIQPWSSIDLNGLVDSFLQGKDTIFEMGQGDHKALIPEHAYQSASWFFARILFEIDCWWSKACPESSQSQLWLRQERKSFLTAIVLRRGW